MKSMPTANQYPFPHGAEWVRADFHLHTKADKEFKYDEDENYFNSSYVDALQQASIRVGVIANHNKFDPHEFKALSKTAKKKRIALLPAVELSVNDGANGVLAAGSQRAKTEQYARDILGASVNKLHEFWRERFTERHAEVQRLQDELPEDIRLQTAFKAKRNAFAEFLRSKLKGSGLQTASYESLQTTFVDGGDLYQRRAELEHYLTEGAALKVRAALLDNLHDFLSYRTPDEKFILYKEKPLSDYSLGQRATVILYILMHLKRHPVIIIDQPEDDLDNETLYTHFIRQLLDRKEHTQFIFATHNPNIPVLGDAEQTIVCRKEGDSYAFDHGSIDAKAIQQRIVTVMEGGEAAFQRRKDIYQLWKSSN